MCTKKRQPYKPKSSELERAPRAFLYELRMLHDYVQSYKHIEIIRNAVLESALVHTRNLLDFFNRNPTPKNDILACHFVDDPPRLTYVEGLRDDINKSLNHLTYSCVKPGKEYVWELDKIQKEIDDAHAKFVQLLPKNKQAEWQELSAS